MCLCFVQPQDVNRSTLAYSTGTGVGAGWLSSVVVAAAADGVASFLSAAALSPLFSGCLDERFDDVLSLSLRLFFSPFSPVESAVLSFDLSLCLRDDFFV